ncbi:MAG: murein biosynthesis integral membrane protein MurJ [Termitinemataceae bacterium]|nr:MAG: murein biosynthesis integral membrane protein MurJ [Termitinemataceae bacterium]
MPSRSLLKSGLIVSLFTLVSRILGLVREMTKAALLGTTALSDAFSVAFLIPNLFRRLFAEGSISVAFIPTFSSFLQENNYRKTKEFLCCFWTVISFFVSLFVGIGILCTPFIVRIFGVQEADETILLTRVMFPFLAFISLAAFFQGILNSFKSFVPSSLGPILLNIATIACAYLLGPFTENSARAMAIGILIGGFLEAAIQVPFVFKLRFDIKWVSIKKALQNEGTRKVLRLIVPTIIGMAAYQLNDIVSTALAAKAGEGIVSSLQYSLRLQELILGVFAVSIGTVLLPELSKHAKAANWKMYNERLSDAVDIITLITIPFTFFGLVFAEEIVRLLFQSRLFDEQSVILTQNVFIYHITGIFFIALNRILAPAFYAQSDSMSPTIAGIVSFAVNITLATILVRFMSGNGIALALSVSGAVNTVMLFFFLKQKINSPVGTILINAFLYLLKIFAFSAIAILPVIIYKDAVINFLKTTFAQNKFFAIVIPLIAALAVFLLILFCLLKLSRDRNLKAVMNLLSRKSQN